MLCRDSHFHICVCVGCVNWLSRAANERCSGVPYVLADVNLHLYFIPTLQLANSPQANKTENDPDP